MPDGKRMSGKRFIAKAVWELATMGKVTLPDGKCWQVEPKEWIEAVKWIYAHVDGPPKQTHEFSNEDGKAFLIQYVIPDENKANSDAG